MIARSLRTAVAAIFILVTLLLPRAAAAAQDTAGRFAELEARGILEPGDIVWITFAFTTAGDDSDMRGKVVAISDVSVTIDATDIPSGETDLTIDHVRGKNRIEIPAARVHSIKVHRKARRWGTLIGGAAGATLGILIAANWEKNEAECTKCYFLFGGVLGAAGMGAGWVVDIMRDQRPIVYSSATGAVTAPRIVRLSFAPQVSKAGSGLVFSVTW